MTPDEVEEIKRHFDIVMEGLRADIKAVAEIVDMLIRKLDAMIEQIRRERKDFFGS